MEFKVKKSYEGIWTEDGNTGVEYKWRIDESGDLWVRRVTEFYSEIASWLPMQFVLDLVEQIQVSEMLEDMQGTEGEG